MSTRLFPAETAHDPKPVHVRKGLVDEAQRTQLVGWIDDGGDGRAEVGGGRGQSSSELVRDAGPDVGRIEGSTEVYINIG